jgi:hypothetical protein
LITLLHDSAWLKKNGNEDKKKEIQLLHYLFRTGQGQHDLYFRTFRFLDQVVA